MGMKPRAARQPFRSPGAPLARPVRATRFGPRLALRRRAPKGAELRCGAQHPRLDTELAAPVAHHAAPRLSSSVGL